MPVMAQTSRQAPSLSEQQGSVYQMKPSEWRATKLTGLNVYNAQNQKIGDINELIVNRDGRIDAVVIGAGGFLGMGEHDVAVPFNQVKWVDVPVRGEAASGSSTRPANNPPRNERQDVSRVYPDHAVVKMTKAQLKTLPQVRYSK
jgi:sporulation protein YlmC with PRC-barrel domain